MLGFQGPAQPSPTLGDAPECRVRLSRSEVSWLQTQQSGAGHRAATEDNTDLEPYLCCKDCSEVQGYSYKRSHLVALRVGKIKRQ